jgi:hypothetical protein
MAPPGDVVTVPSHCTCADNGHVFLEGEIMKSSTVFAFGLAGLAALTSGMSFAVPAPVANLPACRGIPVDQWAATSLTNQADISSVQEIKPETPASETESVTQRWGARIVVRAQPGMTAEWLQRVADCHTAQVAVAEPTSLTASPLDVKGARITVTSAGDGFSVEVTSGDPRVGREILARSRPLAPPAPPKGR